MFSYDLKDYDKLFEEKLELFAKLLDEKPVTWQGTTRTRLDHTYVFPKTESARLRTWVGASGSPSVVRIARYSLPFMLAIIGGPARRFRPYIELYHRAAEQLGTTAHRAGMHSPGFIADTDEEAREVFWPRYRVNPRPYRRRRRARIALRRVTGDRRAPDRHRRDRPRRGRFDLIYTAGS